MIELKAYINITAVLIATAAVGTLSGANGIDVTICAVAVQDRSQLPATTSGLDELVGRALINRGLNVLTIEFDRPADVEYAARERGCSHILYTDIARANPSAGSRMCNSIKRIFGADDAVTINAEVEFRLFAVDEVLPVVSTSVRGKAVARRLYPQVSSRVIELQYAYEGAVMASHQLRTAALSDAFKGQARIVSEVLMSGRRGGGALEAASVR